MSAAVSVRDLSVSYGGAPALRGVSLDVEDREVLALIGPSGCGKTTLLKALNRMHETAPAVRTTGQVRIFGEDIYAADVAVEMVRRRVGMVFQRPNPLPLSIRDNVLFSYRRAPEARRQGRLALDEVVEHALRRVGLWEGARDRLAAPAASLPLDEQQLLCIARLLPSEPRVLLFDEPCSALDPRATARVEALISDLGRQLPVVIVTHNLAQARRIATRSALLWLGELVEVSAELFTAPRDPRTRAYARGELPP